MGLKQSLTRGLTEPVPGPLYWFVFGALGFATSVGLFTLWALPQITGC